MNERESQKGKGMEQHMRHDVFSVLSEVPRGGMTGEFRCAIGLQSFLGAADGYLAANGPTIYGIESTFHSVLEVEGSVVCNTWRPCRAALELRKGIG
jgi:hypothetical protein